MQYLNTTKKGKAGEQLVKELYAVLDRGFSGRAGILSNSTEGNLGDKERLGAIDTPLRQHGDLPRTDRTEERPANMALLRRNAGKGSRYLQGTG